ncbi:hypothetical protein [Brucepastera parasyntrophica]
MYDTRKEKYEEMADITITAETKSPEELAEEIMRIYLKE